MEKRRKIGDGKSVVVADASVKPKAHGSRILTCGTGDMGQLGHGENRLESSKPRKIEDLPAAQFVQVEAGGVHSLFLDSDGKVYSCGANDNGTVPVEGAAPGDTVFEMKVVPLATADARAIQIAAGASFSAALIDDGSVHAWGYLRGESGNLEYDKTLKQMQEAATVVFDPSQHNDERAVKLVAGANHMAILTRHGQLLTMGDGEKGQLGYGGNDKTRPSRTSTKSGWKRVLSAPTLSVSRKRKIMVDDFDDVWADNYWTFAKGKGTGDIFVFGCNNYDQLGVSPHVDGAGDDAESSAANPIITLATRADAFETEDGQHWHTFTGDHHVIALSQEGGMYGIGRNTDNRLGLGNWRRIGTDEENWKMTTLQRITTPPDERIVGVSANGGGSICWTESGNAFAWGCDDSKQLGLGTGDDDEVVIPTPQLIKSKHLDGHRIIQVSVSEQHALFLAQEGV